MKHFRETRFGRFVTKAQAEADPAGTVAETVSDAPEVEAALRWRISTLEAVMLEVAGGLRQPGSGPKDFDLELADRLEQVARDRIPEEHAAP